MTTMIERVARQLEPQAWSALGAGDTLAYRNRRTASLRKARSAIEALREPSEVMLHAVVVESTHLYADRPSVYPAMMKMAVAVERLHMKQRWQTMIDAALAEE